MKLNHLSIKWRLMLISVFVVTIPAILIGGLSYYAAKRQVHLQIEESLHKQSEIIFQNVNNTYYLARKQVQTNINITTDILSEYGAPHLNEKGDLILVNARKEEIVQDKVKSDLFIARSILYSKGKPAINPANRTEVSAQNQMTQKTERITIPEMTVGGKPVAYHYEIVDQIKETAGVETATVFQLIPQGLLRISTNVLTLDHNRAVGTYIPLNSPVYKTVMRKETFYGRAFVVNAWYKTAYEPILDTRGNVIGVLYVGVKENRLVLNDDVGFVDAMRKRLGGVVTIFQLKPFNGVTSLDPTTAGWTDSKAMVRISTNVTQKDGTRAVGTILSKPVYDVIMKGDVYLGRAWVVNAWYMTVYKPMFLEDGTICGILSVGVNEDEFKEPLKNKLSELVIGKSGYISVYSSEGKILLSRDRLRDGQNDLNKKDMI